MMTPSREITQDLSASDSASNRASDSALRSLPSLGSLRNIAQSEGLSSQPSLSELLESIGGPTTSLRVALNFTYIPQYKPSEWNDFDTLGVGGIQFNNNCYNYACNIANNTFAQPGAGSGNPFTALDCADVGAGVQADGLIFSDFIFGCLGLDFSHRVALVIWPGEDFHFYRQDRSGMWSHKPGSTQVTNEDNSETLIADPQSADRGPYTVFCGFYCVRRELVTIGGRQAIAIGQSRDSIVVRLLIFSGRADPEWTISTEAWTDLLARAQGARGRERIQSAPTGGLGYRGFEVYSPSSRADLPNVVAVNQGVVTERSGTQALSWRDVSSLEQQLLDQARQQGYGDLLDSSGVGLPE